MNTQDPKLAERINYAVEKIGSGRRVVEALGQSGARIGRWLRGEFPGRKNIVLIAKAAGISSDWLLTGEGEPGEDENSYSLALGRRIREVRGNVKPERFVCWLNTSTNLLFKYEAGTSNPDAQTLANICVEYDISPAWLLLGEGPMKQNPDRQALGAEKMAAIVEAAADLKLDSKQTAEIASVILDIFSYPANADAFSKENILVLIQAAVEAGAAFSKTEHVKVEERQVAKLIAWGKGQLPAKEVAT